MTPARMRMRMQLPSAEAFSTRPAGSTAAGCSTRLAPESSPSCMSPPLAAPRQALTILSEAARAYSRAHTHNDEPPCPSQSHAHTHDAISLSLSLSLSLSECPGLAQILAWHSLTHAHHPPLPPRTAGLIPASASLPPSRAVAVQSSPSRTHVAPLPLSFSRSRTLCSYPRKGGRRRRRTRRRGRKRRRSEERVHVYFLRLVSAFFGVTVL